MHILLREAQRQKNSKELVAELVEAYKKMGDSEFEKSLDWSQAGMSHLKAGSQVRTLWFQLFDSYENNPSSPGFFYQYRSFWKGLPI